MALGKYGPHVPEKTYVPHNYPEHLFDTGEIQLNYATAGTPDLPALVLLPGQTESWWGYEPAIDLLKKHFQVFAVDLRGQGRSSRTPGRYTFDNFGADIVRFIAFKVRRPAIVSGCSSGGVITAWLSAYAPPGLVRGAHYEDPPLFASEVSPEVGHSIRQTPLSSMMRLMPNYLGDQWQIGDEEGLGKAQAEHMQAVMTPQIGQAMAKFMGPPAPPEAAGARQQMFKEYDPEWGRAFTSGTVGASCDHARMLAAVKCPVLFTHHFRWTDPKTGWVVGAISDLQAARVRELVSGAGQKITYKSLPEMAHAMHGADPKQFLEILSEWAATLPSEAETRKRGVFAQA
jgi:pimeloyl-ACP methyl ester carboxylesterase